MGDNKYILGVTGTIGSGKSYMCKKLKEYAILKGHQTDHLDLDKVGHKIILGYDGPIFDQARERIKNEIGAVDSSGGIDRKRLSKIVFSDRKKMDTLDDIMKGPLHTAIRDEIDARTGLILTEGALLIDKGFTNFCNNNLLLVYVDRDTQYERIKKRGLPDPVVERMIGMQLDSDEKKEKMEGILSSQDGKLWTLDNTLGADPDSFYEIFDDVLKESAFQQRL